MNMLYFIKYKRENTAQKGHKKRNKSFKISLKLHISDV